jgi:hypothetical protein
MPTPTAPQASSPRTLLYAVPRMSGAGAAYWRVRGDAAGGCIRVNVVVGGLP